MSKVVKGAKKFLKKAGKWIAIGVAAYFTAGVALSYFGATSAFAASMPGFGATGIFTKAASFIGLSGPATAAAAKSAGLSLGAFKAGAGAVSTLGSYGSKVAGAMTGSSAVGSGVATMGASAAKTAALGLEASGAVSSALTGGGQGSALSQSGEPVRQATNQALRQAGGGAGSGGGMSVAEKLLIAKTITDTAGGLLAEKPRDPYESFWGYSRDGEGQDIIDPDAIRDFMPEQETPPPMAIDPRNIQGQATPQIPITGGGQSAGGYYLNDPDPRKREDEGNG